MEEDLKYWVGFSLVFSEDLRSAQKIFRAFPEIAEVFQAGKNDLAALKIEEDRIKALQAPGLMDKACRELERLQKQHYHVLTIADDEYPSYLREIFDPPLVLYCAGAEADKLKILEEPAVAVVGARQPSPYGMAVAERLAADLASRGLVVASGMARGIDSIAHWGALRGGKTVAVLGSGLGNIYPPENRRLFDKIKEEGVVITEYPWESRPLGFHFPLRNRIISGLSMALVVIEATRKSGSLISARLALEQNREVMAVPGNVTSELSQGTNWLIKTGAKAVEDWTDVIEELPPHVKNDIMLRSGSTSEAKEPSPSLSSAEKLILGFLNSDSLLHIDEIKERSDKSVSELLSLLLNLELKGLITQSPGKYFQRKL